MESKYVVFDCDGTESVVLFPTCITHNEIVLTSSETGLCPPVAAGFFYIGLGNKVHVEGDSRSLSVKSRPKDAELIKNVLWPNKNSLTPSKCCG